MKELSEDLIELKVFLKSLDASTLGGSKHIRTVIDAIEALQPPPGLEEWVRDKGFEVGDADNENTWRVAVDAEDTQQYLAMLVNEITELRQAIYSRTGMEKAIAKHFPDSVMVQIEPTEEMLNAAIDVDSFKLGDISPLGFRCSPQKLFAKCYKAMLKASKPGNA